ncbi:hypothetical protein [Novispirillum itersonii]|uniref:hypothetical protein n=1 Tax=Novispirillum itersonii TaxID=189 RepID=UPI0012DD4520|nr:hypothetical protein [Novispirillum itersonii]
MVAKVGQQIGQPIAASPLRAGSNGTVSSSLTFRNVTDMANSGNVGPEDEALRFAQNWNSLFQQSQRQAQQQKARMEGVRFGDILTTTEVSAVLVAYRNQGDRSGSAGTTVRSGVSQYERAIRAISSGGKDRQTGEVYSRWM